MTDLFDDLDEVTGLPAIVESSKLPRLGYRDPALLGWPPSLPLEIALQENTPQELCEGYGISPEAWDAMCGDPAFQTAVDRYREALKTEGMSFKLKAQLQSESLLNESWRLIHDPKTPANVRADLIKYTWKCAGYEPKGGGVEGGQTNAFQIVLNLNGEQK